MKKLVKISLVMLASFFFLNFSIQINGNKIEGISTGQGIKVALASECAFDMIRWNCVCVGSGGNCAAFCYDNCSGAIVE